MTPHSTEHPTLSARLALFVWESPQSLLGALALGAHVVRKTVSSVQWRRERIMVSLSSDGAVSLGWFVFYSSTDNRYIPVGLENEDHEWGHSLQSRRYGLLYLPLVGVPSVLRVGYAIAHKHLFNRRWNGYYSGWPERQADLLGKVDTSLRPPP